MLKRITGEDFVQTPGSGSGKVKGDFEVNDMNVYGHMYVRDTVTASAFYYQPNNGDPGNYLISHS